MKSLLLTLFLCYSGAISVTALMCSKPEERYACLPSGFVYNCGDGSYYPCNGGSTCIQGETTPCQNTTTDTCTAAGIFPNTAGKRCVQFYICLGAEDAPAYSRCAEGLFFNAEERACTSGYVHGCSPPTTTTQPPTTTTTTPPPTRCTVGTRRRVPLDCMKYQICHWPGFWITHPCHGFYYNSISERCERDPRVCLF